MELDFDKYCILDGSPTTVLPAPAPKHRSKVAHRNSNGKPKCGNDMLTLNESFNEISFNRYRSASCRDAQSLKPNREGNELLRRGSVYQCSKEVNLLRRSDANNGRKKIEFSRESASTISFGIIDSLCSVDEDSPLMERNRSSVTSLSEQSTSSFCKNKIDLRPRDSRNCSSRSIPENFVPQNDSLSDISEKQLRDNLSFQDITITSEALRSDGNSSKERNSAINLQKLLSAKLALPHLPARSGSDGSKAGSPNDRFTPVRKKFDSFVKSKSHRTRLNLVDKTCSETISRQETICKSVSNDSSDKPNHVVHKPQCEKKDNHSSVSSPLSSPAHLHGILKLENKQGMPFFEFSVRSPEDVVYVAKTWKVDNALSRVYTFHSQHHKRKSNASGWGFKDNRECTMVGQMLVSCYLCTELKGAGAFNDSMVTEFVLYDIAQSRRSISSQDKSISSPDVSKPPLVPDEKPKNGGQFKPSRDSGQFDSPTSQPVSAAELNPEVEIAAIIMQVPFEKRESLKFKTGDGKMDKPLPNLRELCQLEQAKEGVPEASGTMHVVVPHGNHSLPSGESQRGPSPLLDRWRLGGGCDCGGWDMACPINVFGNPNFRVAEGQPLMDDEHPSELFVQGRKDDLPAFSMRAIEEEKYAVDFHAQLSSLQAFSICVSIIHAAETSSAVEQERSKQMLQSDSLRVFAEEEIKNLIDAIEDEDRVKATKKVEERLPSFVLNPPFSPIARV